MAHSNHPLAWFEQQVDKVISRNNRPFPITNKSDAAYCYALQAKGFVFAEQPQRKPRVHISENNCSACEG